MKASFTVTTSRSKIISENGKRKMMRIPYTLSINVLIEGKVINLRYGYQFYSTDHVEGYDSVMAGQSYKLYHQVMPQENDVWEHGKRTFVVGKPSGFLNYTAALLENGKEVAQIKFEDYYKD